MQRRYWERRLARWTAVAGIVGGTTGFAPGADAATGPRTVALWHMNERRGSMIDSGLLPANDGKLAGTITRRVAGVSGRAYLFTRGYVTVPSDSSLNPGSADVTIQASLEPTSLPRRGDFDIIRKGDYPSRRYKVEVLHSGALFCQFAGSSHTAGVTSANVMKPNTGFHTTRCIKTAGSVQAVLDGVTTSRSVSVGSIGNSAPVAIGAHTGGNGDFYKGAMDEVSITFG